MASRASDALDRLARRVIGRNTTSVVYRRGRDSVTLDVALGDKVLRLVNEHGDTQVQRTHLSPLIRASSLVLAGAVTRPQDRDQMVVTWSDGTIETYEVLPYSVDEPHEMHDPYRRFYRVHMKLVSVEVP